MNANIPRRQAAHEHARRQAEAQRNERRISTYYRHIGPHIAANPPAFYARVGRGEIQQMHLRTFYGD
jgi:hypothetical protein